MKFQAIKRHQGIGMEDATYVEAARWGKHRRWWYVLGLVVIFFIGLVVGGIAAPRIAFLFSGQEGLAAFGRLDYAAFGPVGGFVAVRAIFPFFLAGILIAVTLIHQRHPRTLVTAREKISWRCVGHGLVAWFVPSWLIAGLGQYFSYPDTFSFNFDLTTFALFIPLVLVFTAIQTTTEELFFRGYIMQGTSIVWKRRERTGSVHNQQVPRNLYGAIDTDCSTFVFGKYGNRKDRVVFPSAYRRGRNIHFSDRFNVNYFTLYPPILVVL